MMGTLLLGWSLLQPQHHTSRHSFEDVERWVEAFENEERDRRQKPDEVVAALELSPGDRVADIGAGTGYFTRRLAEAVGETGFVYAVDIEPSMLRYIATRAREDGRRNIVPVLATAESPMLPPASVDLIFICNTIHHIENRGAYHELLADTLRPGGRLAVVDFRKDDAVESGPPPEMRLAEEELEKELQAAGFRRIEEHEFLPDQYFVIYGKPGEP